VKAKDITIGGSYAIEQPGSWRTPTVARVLEVAEHSQSVMARIEFEQFEDWVPLGRVVCTAEKLRAITEDFGEPVVYNSGRYGGWERASEH